MILAITEVSTHNLRSSSGQVVSDISSVELTIRFNQFKAISPIFQAEYYFKHKPIISGWAHLQISIVNWAVKSQKVKNYALQQENSVGARIKTKNLNADFQGKLVIIQSSCPSPSPHFILHWIKLHLINIIKLLEKQIIEWTFFFLFGAILKSFQ